MKPTGNQIICCEGLQGRALNVARFGLRLVGSLYMAAIAGVAAIRAWKACKGNQRKGSSVDSP